MMIYMISVLYSLNLHSWYSIWLCLEMMTWYLMIYNNNNIFNLYFMIWQSLSVMMFIYLMLFFYNNLMMMLALLFKMALPPFHYWYLMTFYEWSWKSLLLFIFAHKYTPIMLMTNYMSSYYLLFISLFPLFSFLTMYSNFKLKYFIYSIMLAETPTMFYSWMCSMKLFMLYIMFNMVIMFMLKQIYNYNKINKFMLMMSETIMITIMFSLPPFFTFTLKWIAIVFSSFMSMYLYLMLTLLVYFLLWYSFMLLLKYDHFMKIMYNKIMYLLMFTNIIWVLM